MKKRLFGILLSFALMMGMMPVLGISQTAYADDPVSYPLWVGGTQVTSANMYGDGWSYTPAPDDETPATLTLNNYTYNSGAFYDSAICADENLTIELVGNNDIDSTLVEANYYAIYVIGQLTIQGSGRLDAKGKRYGIYANRLSIEGCNVIAGSTETTEGEYICGGISSANKGDDITIKNATVKANAVVGNAIDSGGDVIIEDSTVEAHSTNRIGVFSYEGNVEINEGAKMRASGGTYGAVDAVVKNAVPGLGWTNTEGTEGKTYFDIDTQGRKLGTNIKCAEFPASEASVTKAPTAKSLKYNGSAQELVTAGRAKGGVMKYALGKNGTTPPEKGWSASIPKRTEAGTYYVWYMAEGDATHADSEPLGPVKVTIAGKPPVTVQHTITYELNGGTLDGMTGTVTWTVDDGTVIALPAPVRDGYTFDYWEGSRYNAGDKYTVTGDHTFKAVWKTAAGGNGKGGSSKGAKTGDDNILGAWIVLLIAALTGTTGMAFARKRRND